MGIQVLFAASEATPYAKTGGLADVAGALPVELAGLGHDVTLVLPYYREIALRQEAEPTGLTVTVPVGKREIKGELFKARGTAKGLKVYFVRRDEYFDRSYLYGTPEADYFDNLERFAFFSRAVLEAAIALGLKPGVVHSNDWQTGLVPLLLKEPYAHEPAFAKTRSIFTVHNTAYQGAFPDYLFETLNLPGRLFTPVGIEFWGKINLLKAGVVYTDMITTVSEAYAREIQTPEYGCGLEGLFSHRSKDLYGVLNGVDYNEWDPAVDEYIPERYSPKDLSGKEACKAEVIKTFGLNIRQSTPVIGMVSRLAAQKGFDILEKALPSIMRQSVALAILGSGEKKYQSMLEKLAAKYPGKLSFKAAFDNGLAHLVEAGSDIFLMPSHYEPCGLNQIYSLKYGTIPVVRATGGLDDTVRDFSETGGKGANGFKFKEYKAEALARKVREAVKAFKDKEAWEELRENAMREDFSWKSSARRYVELYAGAGKKSDPKVHKI